VLSLEGEHKATLLLGTEFQEGLGSFSPDGRWVAYLSNESGRLEVYVRPFVASGSAGAPSLGDGKWQVSKDGAALALPKWRSDGKELVFIGTGNRMMAADVNGSGAAFQAGTPPALFTLSAGAGMDMTPDGKRFLANVPPAQSQQGAQAADHRNSELAGRSEEVSDSPVRAGRCPYATRQLLVSAVVTVPPARFSARTHRWRLLRWHVP
jgi:hypothetical protein